MGILKYAETADVSKTALSQLNLSKVLTSVYEQDTADILLSYIYERTKYANRNSLVYNDQFGTIDMIEDTDIQFKTPYHT